MIERRIGDASAGESAAGSVTVPDEAAVFGVAGRAAGRAEGRAADEGGFFAPPCAVGAPVGLVGLRDAAEPPVPVGFARRAALDRAAAELPPGPRR